MRRKDIKGIMRDIGRVEDLVTEPGLFYRVADLAVQYAEQDSAIQGRLSARIKALEEMTNIPHHILSNSCAFITSNGQTETYVNGIVVNYWLAARRRLRAGPVYERPMPVEVPDGEVAESNLPNECFNITLKK